MLFRLLLSFLLCWPFLGTTQEKGNVRLVEFDQLEFDSEWERQLFADHQSGKTDFLGLLLATGGRSELADRVETEQHLNTVLTRLMAANVTRKSPAKQVKLVSAEIHRSFLKDFRANQLFYQVFEEGTYNCVSSSALHAWFFQKLGIPVAVREQPTHVYLEVYPRTHKIQLETTVSEAGYFQFDRRYKHFYVRFLVLSGVVTEQEYASQDVDFLFARYYFEGLGARPDRLLSIQYSNDAVYNLDRGRVKEALAQFEKAWFLQPDDRTAIAIQNSLNNLITRSDFGTLDEVAWLVEAERHMDFGLDAEVIERGFQRLNRKQLQTEGRTAYFDSAFHYLNEHLINPELKEEIRFYYHCERGRMALHRTSTQQTIHHARQALKIHPHHPDAQDLLVLSVGARMQYSTDYSALLGELDNLTASFPALAENGRLISVRLHLLLSRAGELYTDDLRAEADRLRQQFEAQFATNRELDVDHNLIGRTYGRAAASYFRAGRYSTARSVVEKGLEMAPNNYDLHRRMKSLR